MICHGDTVVIWGISEWFKNREIQTRRHREVVDVDTPKATAAGLAEGTLPQVV